MCSTSWARISQQFQPRWLVGQFTADGNLSGYDEERAAGLGTEIGDSFTGTFTADLTGLGRFDSNITSTATGTLGPELIFYLTGNGSSPLVLDADVNLFATGVAAAKGGQVFNNS
jgi:hypothetical protein